jgi:hypothetical protein
VKGRAKAKTPSLQSMKRNHLPWLMTHNYRMYTTELRLRFASTSQREREWNGCGFRARHRVSGWEVIFAKTTLPTNRKVHKKKMQIIPFILTTFVTRLDSKISQIQTLLYTFTAHIRSLQSPEAVLRSTSSLARYSSLSRYASCPHCMFS